MPSYKNGEEIDVQSMNELEAPVFYVIQLDFAIKLGMSANALRRWQGYFRHYNGVFKILYLNQFRRASEGYSYHETDRHVPRQDWAAAFERKVIAKLSDMGVKPFYTGDPVASNEYYRLADKRKILKAVSNVKKDNGKAGDQGKATKNRTGNRRRSLRMPSLVE